MSNGATRQAFIARTNHCQCSANDCPCWHDAERLVDDIAAAERERLREKAKTLWAKSAGAGWHIQAWMDEDVLPAVERLLADPEAPTDE